MLKSVAAGAAALAIMGSSIVYAQQRSGGPDGVGSGGFGHGLQLAAHYRPSIDDVKAFTDARIAALKAGLEMKPDQEKNWTALETTLRDLAKQHDDQFAKWRAQNKDDGDQRRDALQRLQLISDRLATQAADLKALATAATPLYNSLDDAQKSRFGHLLRAASFGGGHHEEGPGEHHWRHAEAEHPDGPGGPEGGPTFE